MLSPEYLNEIEFNDVVKLYNKLNIDITADIINRISKMQDIIPSTKYELEILKQMNGLEVFKKALEETSILTAQTKRALKLLFEDMIKEDIEGYKELYGYQNKPFKLSEVQYKILNQGLKETNKTLKNFNNTIAFQSKQAYVDTIDMAYMKVVSGAFDYATAIQTSCQELANKGITLKDKLGRNVQLEVAVRRNIMFGIQNTANNINRDIEEYLGCDGYEVTAHLGARPTHAVAQGKQYAISHDTKISRKYKLWSEVSDLWEEYNCRHTYFGIILGISEPKYTDKELKEFRDATVTLNGKKIPYYEATQKQRQLENAIRKQKRTVQTLEKANLDNKSEKRQLAQLQKKYKDFCKETGLEKDYQRLQVAKNNSTKPIKSSIISKNANKKENKMKYQDLTDQYTIKKQYQLKKQKYFIADDGTKYNVDGKRVKLEPNIEEIETAKLLGKMYGGKVKLIPKVTLVDNVETPDYIVNNEKFDRKGINGSSKTGIYNRIHNKQMQADNFVIDITNAKLEIDDYIKQAQEIYTNKRTYWVNTLIITKDNQMIRCFKRK